MEAEAPTKKEDGMRLGPYLLMESHCFRSGENQGETIPILCKPCQPAEGLTAIGGD